MSGSWMVSCPVSTNIWYHYVAKSLGYLVNTLQYFCYQSIYPASPLCMCHFNIKNLTEPN